MRVIPPFPLPPPSRFAALPDFCFVLYRNPVRDRTRKKLNKLPTTSQIRCWGGARSRGASGRGANLVALPSEAQARCVFLTPRDLHEGARPRALPIVSCRPAAPYIEV